VGPTACGKTSLSLSLALELGAEIISADAVAVYRGFDLGSAKPTPRERGLVRHHLIDLAEPEEDFTAARFAELAGRAVEEILARGSRVIVAGGSGLYLRALLGGLFQAPPVDKALRAELAARAEEDPQALHSRLALVDPRAAARLNPRDKVRVIRALEVFLQTGRPISAFQGKHRFQEQRFDHLKLGILVDRETLGERIARRTRLMFQAGLEEEVRALLEAGVDPGAKPMSSIGYKEALALVRGEIDQEEAVRRTIRETRRLAKRQMTWFRADEEVTWLPGDDPQAFLDAARAFWGENDVQSQ